MKEQRKSLTNRRRTEKSDEYDRGMRSKNGKEYAAGEDKNELHLYYIIGRAARSRHRTSLAVVAYRDAQLYCICTDA